MGSRLSHWVFVIGSCIVAGTSCYEPTLTDCTLSCGLNSSCPSGQHCDHGFCSVSRVCAAPTGGSAGTASASAGAAQLGGRASQGGNLATDAGGPPSGGSDAATGGVLMASGGTQQAVPGTGGVAPAARGNDAGAGAGGSAGEAGGGGAGPIYIKPNPVDAVAQFGVSLAIEGDTLVVGAPTEGPGTVAEQGLGAAYVFVRQGASWTQTQRLSASTPLPGDYFGDDLALVGDTLFVSAPNAGPLRAGEVHVYTRSGGLFAEVATLRASNAEAGDGFGVHLRFDGTTLVVGAPTEDGDNNGTPETGAAYVFTGQGASWTERALLRAPLPSSVINFGGSFAISGDTLVIGALAFTSGKRSTVDIYRGSGASWSLEKELEARNGDNFGVVSLDGDTLAVGAAYDPSNGTSETDSSLQGAGAAYVFERSGTDWVRTAYLKAAEPQAGSWFGLSLLLHQDTLYVGAYRETLDGKNACGVVHVFQRSGANWLEGPPLVAFNRGAEDRFGASLGYSAGILAVGAKEEGGNGLNPNDDSVYEAGAVYLLNEP